MSKSGGESSPLPEANLSKEKKYRLRTVVGICAVTSIVTLATTSTALSAISEDDPLYIPKHILNKTVGCDPVDKKLEQSLLSDILILKKDEERKSRYMVAQDNNLHLPNTDEVRASIKRNPSQATAILSAFTKEQYGFEVKSKIIQSDQNKKDALGILASIENVPIEFMQAISERAMKEVVIKYDIGGAGGKYKAKEKQVELLAGNSHHAFTHEALGHAAALATSLDNCWIETADYPQIEDFNPQEFSYDNSNSFDEWHGITFSQYGSTSQTEDIAEVAEFIGKGRLPEREQTVKLKKIARILASWEQLESGTGRYYAKMMASKIKSFSRFKQ